LLARNDITPSPDGAAHDTALPETHDVSVQMVAGDPAQIGELSAACTHPDVALNDNAASPRQTASQTTRPSNASRMMGRALLKPLIAIATAQYVIVTVLAALTAITVASTAGKAINAKFELIIAALKRF
jgi:hypothetical protein